MTEAEEADRTSGVWEEVSDKWEPGDMVQIEGLKSRADLNGTTGVLLKWNAAASRWAVTVVATDEKVKVRHENLRRSSEEYQVKPSAEAAGASGTARAPLVLPMAAGTSAISAQLAAEQYAVVDDFMSGEAVATMRAEATALLSGGHMAPSQSTRYDEARGEVVAYEKHNVLSAKLQPVGLAAASSTQGCGADALDQPARRRANPNPNPKPQP